MINYTRCPVCSSSSLQKVFTARDHTVSQEQFEIWQCAGCCLRFTQNVPENDAIRKYYLSDNYISHSNSSKGIVNRMYKLVRYFTLVSKRKFVERITGVSKGTLLDIGAGTGAFLNEMHLAGWKVEGVEPDGESIKRAAALYGLQLKSQDHLFDFPEQSFDAVTLWHVLEHVHELHRYIEQLKVLCKKNGKIIIAVPNYTSSDAACYGPYWAAYDVPRHLYHFSPAAMQQLITSHGCRIESIKPMWFDSFYVSILSEKYKTGKSNILNGLWRGLQSNRKALSNYRKASSIIYIISVNGE